MRGFCCWSESYGAKQNSALFLNSLVVVIGQYASVSGMTYAHMTLQNYSTK